MNNNNTHDLAKSLMSQAKRLVFVAKQMQQAAGMLNQIHPTSRLSPEGREAISRAAQRRWKAVRSHARSRKATSKPRKPSVKKPIVPVSNH